jgi:endonuclease YncB( thermonuclease family)
MRNYKFLFKEIIYIEGEDSVFFKKKRKRLPNKKSLYSAGEIDAVQVVKVYDGDTIRVRFKNDKEERVRFLLVDTPETSHPRKGVEPYGEEAKLFTRYMINQSRVVELGYDAEKRDHYGRLLAYVYVDRKLLQEELAKKGLARVSYTRNRNPDMVRKMKEAEQMAKSKGKGIWSNKTYVGRSGYHPEKMNWIERTYKLLRGKVLRVVLDSFV